MLDERSVAVKILYTINKCHSRCDWFKVTKWNNRCSHNSELTWGQCWNWRCCTGSGSGVGAVERTNGGRNRAPHHFIHLLAHDSNKAVLRANLEGSAQTRIVIVVAAAILPILLSATF